MVHDVFVTMMKKVHQQSRASALLHDRTTFVFSFFGIENGTG